MLKNSKDIFYQESYYLIKLQLLSIVPMQFVLHTAELINNNSTMVTGSYDLADKGIILSVVAFVNSQDHVEQYKVQLEQISSSPIAFEVLNLERIGAYDWWTGETIQ